MIDRPPPAVIGSSPEQLDDATLYELGTEHLLRLGLLERRFDTVKRGEYPVVRREIGWLQVARADFVLGPNAVEGGRYRPAGWHVTGIARQSV